MKKITVAVVVDDLCGMLLFGKRQSKDRVLIAEFMEYAADRPVFVGNFSKKLFESYEGVTMCENPLEDAPDGAICFIENFPLTPYLSLVNELIIYRWNRLYHSDVKLDVDPKAAGYKLSSVSEFAGSSHDRITKEIYVR